MNNFYREKDKDNIILILISVIVLSELLICVFAIIFQKDNQNKINTTIFKENITVEYNILDETYYALLSEENDSIFTTFDNKFFTKDDSFCIKKQNTNLTNNLSINFNSKEYIEKENGKFVFKEDGNFTLTLKNNEVIINLIK